MRIPNVGNNASAIAAASQVMILPETFVWLWLGLVVLATHGHEMTAWSAVALFSRRSFHLFTTDQDEEDNESSSLRRRKGSSHRHSSSSSSSPRATSSSNKLWRFPGEQGLAILILTSLWTLVRPVGYQSYAWIIPWILASRDSLLSWILSLFSSSSFSRACADAEKRDIGQPRRTCVSVHGHSRSR